MSLGSLREFEVISFAPFESRVARHQYWTYPLLPSNDFQEHLYQLYGKEENFRGILYPGVKHEYTPAMWDETLRWLKRHL
jgi:hypothetical protein